MNAPGITMILGAVFGGWYAFVVGFYGIWGSLNGDIMERFFSVQEEEAKRDNLKPEARAMYISLKKWIYMLLLVSFVMIGLNIVAWSLVINGSKFSEPPLCV